MWGFRSSGGATVDGGGTDAALLSTDGVRETLSFRWYATRRNGGEATAAAAGAGAAAAGEDGGSGTRSPPHPCVAGHAAVRVFPLSGFAAKAKPDATCHSLAEGGAMVGATAAATAVAATATAATQRRRSAEVWDGVAQPAAAAAAVVLGTNRGVPPRATSC